MTEINCLRLVPSLNYPGTAGRPVALGLALPHELFGESPLILLVNVHFVVRKSEAGLS